MTEPLQDLSPRAVVRAIAEHRRFNATDWDGLPGVVVWESPRMVLFVTGLPVPWANGVELARLRPREADRRIREAIDELRSAGIPASWVVGPYDRPRDLGDRLVAHGFRFDTKMPWMAADLARPRRMPTPAGLRIERVRSPELHEAWLDVMTRGFGWSPGSRATLDTLGRHARNLRSGPWVRFVGFIDGRPVASSGVIAGGGVAGIYNVATLARMRRRGFGTAMTLAAMRHGRSLGHRVAVLETSPLGLGVYERLGFTHVCTTRVFLLECRT